MGYLSRMCQALGMLLSIVVLSACSIPTSTPTPAPTSAPVEFLYSVDTHPLEKHEDHAFEISDNNCGSPVAIDTEISRTRTYRRTLNLQLTNTIVAEVGGGVPNVAEAKLGAELAKQMGVDIEEVVTSSFVRKNSIPPNSMVTVALQWWEWWDSGEISVQYLNEEPLDTVPFRLLNTLYLSQLFVDYADCAVAIPVPERDVEISVDAALAAQDAAMAGLMAARIVVTESEFSSLVNLLLQQNAGMASIGELTFWFTPDAMYIRTTLPDGSSFDIVGNIAVENSQIIVDLIGASSDDYVVPGSTLDVIEGAINRALDDITLGVALDLKTGDGFLEIGIAQ